MNQSLKLARAKAVKINSRLLVNRIYDLLTDVYNDEFKVGDPGGEGIIGGRLDRIANDFPALSDAVSVVDRALDTHRKSAVLAALKQLLKAASIKRQE